MALEHQKLDVYRHALALLRTCDEIARLLPKGRAALKEQLDSAATSVVANIAEGAGEFSGEEKRLLSKGLPLDDRDRRMARQPARSA